MNRNTFPGKDEATEKKDAKKAPKEAPPTFDAANQDIKAEKPTPTVVSKKSQPRSKR